MYLQIPNLTALIIQENFDKIKIFCEKIFANFRICAIMITNERIIVYFVDKEDENAVRREDGKQKLYLQG
jgi:hypothetical protein